MIDCSLMLVIILYDIFRGEVLSLNPINANRCSGMAEPVRTRILHIIQITVSQQWLVYLSCSVPNSCMYKDPISATLVSHFRTNKKFTPYTS